MSPKKLTFIMTNFQRNIVDNCHSPKLSGISSNISESTCAFSKYLSTVAMKVHLSDNIKNNTKRFTNQFKLFFIHDCNHDCKVKLALDERIHSKLQYDLKCLGLNVFENLTSWLNKTGFHKCI